jgi:hypothetical protein
VWSPYPLTEQDKEPHRRARRKPFTHQEARDLVSELYLLGSEERDVTESTKTLALFDFFTLTDVSVIFHDWKRISIVKSEHKNYKNVCFLVCSFFFLGIE